ncbi:MAG: hypothetical protein RXO22_07015 [Thermocladium sp.]|jgi:methionyl-tRNA synthetase
MAYVPKTLMLGRCWRCGKRIYKADDYYTCSKCGTMYCPTCAKKMRGKCAIDGAELIPH